MRGLEAFGFRLDRVSGSHHMMVKPGWPRPVPVPVHGTGTVRIDDFAQDRGGTEQTADFAQMRDFRFSGQKRRTLRRPSAAICAGTVLPLRSGTLRRRRAGRQTCTSEAIASDQGLRVPPAVRASAWPAALDHAYPVGEATRDARTGFISTYRSAVHWHPVRWRRALKSCA